MRTLAGMTPQERADTVGKRLVMCYNGGISGPVRMRQHPRGPNPNNASKEREGYVPAYPYPK